MTDAMGAHCVSARFSSNDARAILTSAFLNLNIQRSDLWLVVATAAVERKAPGSREAEPAVAPKKKHEKKQ